MTVEELLAALNDLPVEALQKPVYIDQDVDTAKNSFLTVIEIAEESNVILGYIIRVDK